ncbi:hypothetical protein BH24ACT2_BH24ACT2_14400 [soil metagenome]
MSLVVLVILAMVWAVFLLPQLFRARAERSTDLIGAFGRQLSVLERATSVGQGSVTPLRPAAGRRPAGVRPAGVRPAGTVAPARAAASRSTDGYAVARRRSSGRASVRKRRRDILCGLLVAMGASLVLSLIPALGKMVWVHLALDVAFVAYLALLVRVRNLAAERELKVRYLPTMANPQPQLLLRRSAN